ncbi:MAG: hypothetical protein ACQEW8_14120 [Actinomycetota bacterium]
MTAIPARPARERLAAARSVHRSRNEQRTRGDTAYVVYITVLVAAIVGVPVVRAVILGLAEPAAIAALTAIATGPIVTVLGVLVWCGALALGRVRGPIVPTPFAASIVGGSDLSPRVAWTRRLLGSSAGAVALLIGIAALGVSGLLASGTAAAAAGQFLLGAALVSVTACALWLAGQALGRRGIAVLGAALLVLLVTSALAALPPLAHLVALGICAVAAVGTIPPLLARLSGDVVLAHAERAEAMGVLAGTGDLSGALDRVRPRPSVGRRWRMRFPRPLVLAVLQRDAIGAARTPVRALVSLATLAAAGAAWAAAGTVPPGVRWAPALAAGLLAFAALGALTDGMRDASDTAGRPSLYRQTPGRLLLLHAPLPLLAVSVVSGGAVLLAGGDLLAAIGMVALGVVVVAVRAFDSAKGPLPISLMMPVPTPMGDASAIGIWLWQADALLLTAATSQLLASAATGTLSALIWVVPALALLIALTAGRLHRAL